MTGSARSSNDERPASVNVDWRACFCGQLTATLIAWLVIGLLLLDGTIVIDEDERTRVLGVRITLSTLVTRAEVA